MATPAPRETRDDRTLLEEVKRALSKGTVEVDSEGKVVTEQSASKSPADRPRHSQLKKRRTWYQASELA